MRRFGAVVAAVLLLAGCTAGMPAQSPSPSPAAGTPRTLASFYSQRLTWAACARGECATVQVPLDYTHPEGRTLALALTRVRATAEPRLGTLFVNPGGPGVPGTTFASAFDRAGLERYDVVGWDPRGVAGQQQLRCLDDAASDRADLVDVSPDDDAEVTALLASGSSFAAACAANTDAGLLAHVSTEETARDLDVLRAAVGDERLSYYGASYGTLIGARYAELFASRVGRIVLDAPVDVTGVQAVSQAAGFEAAFRRFAAWCAGQRCSLGGTETEAAAAALGWLKALDASPLPVGDRLLTQSLAAVGMARFLYSGPAGWQALLDAVAAARAGDGRRLLDSADAMNGRRSDGSRDGSLASGLAIRCADGPRRSTSEALATWEGERSASPFGSLLGPDVGCEGWPVAARPWTTPRAAGSAPILVVSATGDPATPHAWAELTAATLASGVLLSVEGGGHVSYGRNTCVDAAVRAYLADAAAPRSLTCPESP